MKELGGTFLVLAPLFLFGLLLGGVINILITRRRVEAIMGGQGLKSMINAAAIGVPLPLCSCAVVPIAVTLGRKGASPPAVMSFLITTPESGVDSILLTWVLMGPWVAIYRPFASFMSALLAGVVAIGWLPTQLRAAPKYSKVEAGKSSFSLGREGHDPGTHDHDACGHDHGHGHHHHDLDSERDYVGFRGVWWGMRHAAQGWWRRAAHLGPLRGWYKPDFYETESPAPFQLPEGTPPLSETVRRVWRFAFIELADDILPSLVIGVLLAGAILAVFPANLAEYGLGAGWKAYLIMAAVGIPLYMCASASTPVAAALVAKGLSPGAAIVFLLGGPGTNVATIVALNRLFGRRFVAIYVGSIGAGAIAAGALFDALIGATGWQAIAHVPAPASGAVGFVEWTGAILLLALIGWRFSRRHVVAGLAEPISNFRVAAVALGARRIRRFAAVLLLAAAAVWLASGFFIVPTGSVAYGKLFGRVVWRDLGPGLHYLPPRPFAQADIWPVMFPHRLTIGLATPPSAPANAPQNPDSASSVSATAGTWHSPDSPLAQESLSDEYLSGDQDYVEAVITVIYSVTDPYVYFYRVENPGTILEESVRSVVGEYVSRNTEHGLLSRDRPQLEKYVVDDVSAHLGPADKSAGPAGAHPQSNAHHDFEIPSLGITIQSVNVIDIHPPAENLLAFRDASNAMEDSATSVLNAQTVLTLTIPQTTGNARIEQDRAFARGEGQRVEAAAESLAIQQRAVVVAGNPALLQDILWFETMERSLAGKEQFILPPGTSARDLIIWRSQSPAASAGNHSQSHE
ncbi:MAG: SO_0444 family Cu/Zn efflux transporter [Chthoniobacterales bacterium]